MLAVLAGLLLVVFGGITDHLIPLFAVGALLAFTMSQLGMVAHWRTSAEPRRSAKIAINAVGATATSIALLIVIVSKFTHGAWITAVVIPGIVMMLRAMKGYNERLSSITRAEGPLDVSNLSAPLVVIPLRRLDQVAQKALRFALTISPDIYVVQVLAEELDTEDLRVQWRDRVEEPVRRSGSARVPHLALVRSPYRQFYARFIQWLQQLTTKHPDRQVIVLIPELVHRRWYQFLINHRAWRLKAELLMKGGPHVSVMSTPWYPDLPPRRHERAVRARQASGARESA